MRTPATSALTPEENQLTEALACVLNRVPNLARTFSLLFVRADATAEAAVGGAAIVGVETQVVMRDKAGGVIRPDLAVRGSSRSV